MSYLASEEEEDEESVKRSRGKMSYLSLEDDSGGSSVCSCDVEGCVSSPGASSSYRRGDTETGGGDSTSGCPSSGDFQPSSEAGVSSHASPVSSFSRPSQPPRPPSSSSFYPAPPSSFYSGPPPQSSFYGGHPPPPPPTAFGSSGPPPLGFQPPPPPSSLPHPPHPSLPGFLPPPPPTDRFPKIRRGRDTTQSTTFKGRPVRPPQVPLPPPPPPQLGPLTPSSGCLSPLHSDDLGGSEVGGRGGDGGGESWSWWREDAGEEEEQDDDSEGSVESERLEALFDACDTDGDGYITSANLAGVLGVLGLRGTGETLARDLGCDGRGRVSRTAFLSRRKQLASEVHAIRVEGGSVWTKFPSGGGKERRDDSPSQQPPPLPPHQRGRRPTKGVEVPSRQVLEATNKLHLAALGSLKGEILELSSRLQMVSQERDLLEKTLTVTQLEKVRVERESEDRLDSQAQRYEERLTELHSVIAELSRKIDEQRINVIAEEDNPQHEDYSHSELSNHENDVTEEDSTSEAVESEDPGEEARDNTATDASTSCDIDDRAVEAGEGIADLDVSECPRGGSGDTSSCRISGDGCRSLSALEEEVKALREENMSLQHALALAQHSAASQRNQVTAIGQEREALRKKLREYQRMQPAIPPQSPQVADAVTVRGLRGAPIAALASSGGSAVSGSAPGTVSPSPSPQPPESHTPTDDSPIICRLAERVRLRKAESGDQRITGTDLSVGGVWTTGVAEQLVAGVQEDSDAQELYHALATAGGALAPHERLKEFELEIERLHAKIDHLKAQNDVLAVTLSESKAHCDHLSILIGKYESNSTALQLAVTNLDHTIEAYEVLVALLESEIALLLASCKAAGVGVKGGGVGYREQDDLVVVVRRAQEQRRSTENVARHLLSRLERSSGHGDVETWSEANISHNTSTASSTSSGVDSDVSRGEEQRLRETIGKMRDERSQVGVSLLPLESLHVDPLTRHYPLTLHDAHKLDLENAVLMQELTAMREDRAELRAQVYLLEREKAGLELRVGTCEAQAAAYCATIDHLKSELSIARPDANHEVEGEGDSGLDSSSPEIMEALRRERQLKTRVQDLVTTLEKVTKNSEARHMQSGEFINDLKKANGALLTAVDRLKKKYALKVKRMEQQMMGMVERHAHQVRVLKQRIANLEDDTGGQQTQMISTASETSL